MIAISYVFFLRITRTARTKPMGNLKISSLTPQGFVNQKSSGRYLRQNFGVPVIADVEAWGLSSCVFVWILARIIMVQWKMALFGTCHYYWRHPMFHWTVIIGGWVSHFVSKKMHVHLFLCELFRQKPLVTDFVCFTGLVRFFGENSFTVVKYDVKIQRKFDQLGGDGWMND